MSGNTPPPQDEDERLHNDVVGKIDQLLSKHRPKAPAAEEIPVLTQASGPESPGDGIPVLTDVVGPPGRNPASSPAAMPTPSAAALILQRLEIALDTALLRMLAKIDRNDTDKARMLDGLMTQIKQELPGIVRNAITPHPENPARPDESRRL